MDTLMKTKKLQLKEKIESAGLARQVSEVKTIFFTEEFNFSADKNCSFLKRAPKKNIFLATNLTSDKNIQLSNPNVTQYDLAVMDAAYTLYDSRFSSFSIEMIVRIMSGNLEQDVTPQKAEAVTRAINKFKNTRVQIDYKEKMIGRKNIKERQTYHLESYLMPLKDVEIKVANYKTVKGYQFFESPVLYSYAEQTNQIINVPRNLLETKDFLSDTDEVIVIKRYLIKRIEAMKNTIDYMRLTCIIYEWYDVNTQTDKGMFLDLDYRKEDFNNWRRKKSHIHKTVTVILKTFVSKKYIKSFSEIKEGRRINGIEIDF